MSDFANRIKEDLLREGHTTMLVELPPPGPETTDAFNRIALIVDAGEHVLVLDLAHGLGLPPFVEVSGFRDDSEGSGLTPQVTEFMGRVTVTLP